MMITRCPACATAFRVTPEQLKAMHGKVRCGQCQHVFNALDTLLDAATEPVAPIESIEPQLEFPVMGEPVAEIPEKLIENPAPPTQAVAESNWQTKEAVALPYEASQQKSTFRTWAWALAASLALLLLLLQAILQFRVELGVLSPQAKSVLQALCKPLGCDLPLPRKGDLIGIESSDLNPDQKNIEQLVLSATLKNRAPFVQAYPHLELTLTDTADRPLLRKVLLPSDYLSKGIAISSGFPANSEVAVNLTFIHDNPANAVAAGYRLYLFYP